MEGMQQLRTILRDTLGRLLIPPFAEELYGDMAKFMIASSQESLACILLKEHALTLHCMLISRCVIPRPIC